MVIVYQLTCSKIKRGEKTSSFYRRGKNSNDVFPGNLIYNFTFSSYFIVFLAKTVGVVRAGATTTGHQNGMPFQPFSFNPFCFKRISLQTAI